MRAFYLCIHFWDACLRIGMQQTIHDRTAVCHSEDHKNVDSKDRADNMNNTA